MKSLRTNCMVLLLACLSPLPALAVGAIAVDDDQSLSEPAYGFSVRQPNRQTAERVALNYCRQNGDNCRAVVWFETCGAYAASARHYGYGWGATKSKATSDALKMCGSNSCKVVVAECER
ncbi:DUF4189 domain-containing protein [Massilia sp. W12]|uniref:DUF4189 domain-containing protein n=1 Tax=Massilia sp. W12 TaxID=3126507 RepID=UPI0030D0D7F0